jgi:hypothetical protein
MKVKELITEYQKAVITSKKEYERQVEYILHDIKHLDSLDPETEVSPEIWDDYELPPATRLDDNNLDFPVQ